MIDLSKLPYKDGIPIVVQEQKEEEGLTKWMGEKLVIDRHAKLWQQYGDIALGYWWDEIIDGNGSKEDWLWGWELMPLCWTPERYMMHKKEFYEWCLCSIEKEAQEWTRERIENLLRRKVYVERENVRKMEFEQILEFPRDRIEWRKQYHHMTDTFWYLVTPYDILSKFYHVCLRLYVNVEHSLRNRLIKCISSPLMILIEANGEEIPDVLVDCLKHADTYLTGAVKIWNRAWDFFTRYPYLQENMGKRINACLFDILENKLEWSVGEKG